MIKLKPYIWMNSLHFCVCILILCCTISTSITAQNNTKFLFSYHNTSTTCCIYHFFVDSKYVPIVRMYVTYNISNLFSWGTYIFIMKNIINYNDYILFNVVLWLTILFRYLDYSDRDLTINPFWTEFVSGWQQMIDFIHTITWCLLI